MELTRNFSDEELSDALRKLAAEYAPAFFAVAQVYGDNADGRIAAWGMAFDDHVEVVSVDTGTNGRLRSVEGALRWFGSMPDISARIVWMADEPSPAKVSFER